MRLGKPDGPVVGKLLPGLRAELLVLDGVHAQLSLDASPKLELPKDFRPWVEASALVDAPVPVDWEAGAPGGRRLYAETSVVLQPGGAELLPQACRVVSVGAFQGGHVEVAQADQGIVLTGWAKEPLLRRECPARVAFGGHPEDFSEAHDKVAAKALDAAIRARKPFFWLVESEGAFRCAERRVSEKDGTLSGEDAEKTGVLTYRFSSDGERVTLLGPSFTPRDRKQRGWSEPCAAEYALADAKSEGIVVINLSGVEERESKNPPPVAAYHPDDAEVWFLTREACEAAAAKAGAPAGQALARPVHSGC